MEKDENLERRADCSKIRKEIREDKMLCRYFESCSKIDCNLEFCEDYAPDIFNMKS